MKTKIEPTDPITAQKLIKAISYSQNNVCALICINILTGKTTISAELELGRGKFMTAVLNGDFETCVKHADTYNKMAILTHYFHD